MRFSPAGSRVSNCTSRGVLLRNAIVRSTDLKPATWPVANWGMGQPQRKLSRTPVPICASENKQRRIIRPK